MYYLKCVLNFYVIFMIECACTRIFFINLPYGSGLFNISDRKSIRAQARQIAAQVLKVCEEEARNEALSVHSTHHKLHFLHTNLNQTPREYIKAHNDKMLVLYVLNTEYHFIFSINASTPTMESTQKILSQPTPASIPVLPSEAPISTLNVGKQHRRPVKVMRPHRQPVRLKCS